MATDPNIILQAGQINDPSRLAQGQMDQFTAMQAAQKMRAQNMLKQVMAQPGAFTPDGKVAPNALKAVMQFDPQTGFALAKQNRDTELDQLSMQMDKIKIAAGNNELIQAKLDFGSGAYADGIKAYEAAIKAGRTPADAAGIATKARNERLAQNGGQLSEQEEQQLASQPFDIDKAKIIASHNPDYVASIAADRAQMDKDREFGLRTREEDYKEKHGDAEFALEKRHELFEESKPQVVGGDSMLYDPRTGTFKSPPQPGASDPDSVFSRMIGAESRGNQFAANGSTLQSPKGALGIAQVMPGTAKEAAAAAGVPFDPVKYRNDPQYNATIGKAYFTKLVNRYGGDTTKAAAAYNAGPGRVDAAIARGGENWANLLPAETKAYIAKVAGGGMEFGAIAKAVANYDLKATSALSRLKPAARERVMEEVYKLNPSYDETTFTEKAKFAAGMGSDSPNTPGAIIKSANALTAHLGTLQTTVTALQNAEANPWNRIKNYVRSEMGYPEPTNFNALKGIVSREIVKFISGGGGGVTEQQDIAREIQASRSPEQLNGIIERYKDIAAGQLEATRLQYQQTLGKNDFDRYLSPETRKQLGGSQVAHPADIEAIMKKYGG